MARKYLEVSLPTYIELERQPYLKPYIRTRALFRKIKDDVIKEPAFIDGELWLNDNFFNL